MPHHIMKKILNRKLILIFILIFCATILEAKTIKEHPLIKPFPGSVLAENMSRYNRFNAEEFYVTNPKTKKRETVKAKGEYYHLLYEVRTSSGDRVKDISAVEYFENYRLAVESMGGEVVYEGGASLVFTIPKNGNGKTWCKLTVNAGLGQQYLDIIDEKSLRPVMVPGTVSKKQATSVSKTKPSVSKSTGRTSAPQTVGKVSSGISPSQQKNSGTVYSSGTVYNASGSSDVRQINPQSSIQSDTHSLPGQGTANTTPLPSTSPQMEYQSVDKPLTKKLDLPDVDLAVKVDVIYAGLHKARNWLGKVFSEYNKIEYVVLVMNKGAKAFSGEIPVRIQLINVQNKVKFFEELFFWQGPNPLNHNWTAEGLQRILKFYENPNIGAPKNLGDVQFVLDVDPENNIGEAQKHRGNNRFSTHW